MRPTTTFLWMLGVFSQVSVGPQLLAQASFEQNGSRGGDALARTPLQKPQGGQSKLFDRVPASLSGLDLAHQMPSATPFEYLQDHGCASGVCVGDYDNDGDTDIYITNYDRGNRLYRNDGNWRFEDVSGKAGVSALGKWSSGASFADVNNDGRLDLFVSVFNSANLLFLNQRDGTFKDVAPAAGLDFAGASVMMAFADYDQDGFLDGYLVTNRKFIGADHRLPKGSAEAFRRSIVRVNPSRRLEVEPRYRELFGVIEKGEGRAELIIAGQEDALYRNRRDGVFVQVNGIAGIQGFEIGLAATWWDYNDDGLPDLYVSNDYKGPDRLYQNLSQGRFIEVTKEALPHIAWASMGADVADVNNDGRLDLFSTDMAGSTHARHMLINGDLDDERWFLLTSDPPQYRRNALYLNTGTSECLEVACLAGLAATDWTWSPKFGDFDNDGWIDLFVSNGMSRDFMNSDVLRELKGRGHAGWRSAAILKESNLSFKNLGDLKFQNVTEEWGLGLVAASFGAAVADFDRDGDLDLIVTNFEEGVALYRNNSSQGHRLLIRLKGTASNTYGVGARIVVETDDGLQCRAISLSSGFMSANEPIAHFGLGEHASAGKVLVDWPSGRKQVLTNLAAGYLYSIVEPAESAQEPSARAQPLFQRAEYGPHLRHVEEPFDDFAQQPLLPWKLSRWGPAMALGDVNGDHREDLFLGGGAGHAGTLALRQPDGIFRQTPMPCLDEDKMSEDLGALLLDLDSDDDLDLFVVSGGVETQRQSGAFRSRLYLNDGRGMFQKSPEGTLPDLREPASTAVAADFDRDGDLDIFVGAYRYPGSPFGQVESRLYRNTEGRFEDATAGVGLAASKLELVTAALWSDVNSDGWVDLLVTQHWGPIRLFINNSGSLNEQTREAGLQELSGWWNGLAAADLNADGAIDYVATNWGLNNPRRLAPAAPVVGYLIEALGRPLFVPGYNLDGSEYPLAGREEMAEELPTLIEKFPTFGAYASAKLVDLLPPDQIAKAVRYEAKTLASTVLLNNGSGRFSTMPLPSLAQAAPSFGIAIADFNADGRADLFLAQNFSHAHPEAGRQHGGLSLVLLGSGNGAFKPVGPAESGVSIRQDARSAVAYDFDGNTSPDLLVGINDGEVIVLKNRQVNSNTVTVRLVGSRGNRAAVGARLTVQFSDASTQTAEVYAGSGYLSQSPLVTAFPLKPNLSLKQIRVTWPEGRITTHHPSTTAGVIVLPREEP